MASTQTVKTTLDDSPYGEHPQAGRPAQRRQIHRHRRLDLGQPRRPSTPATDDIIETPLPDNAIRLEVSNNHMGNFFDCVRIPQRSDLRTSKTGHRSAVVGHLIAIALRTGQKFQLGSRDGNVSPARTPRKPTPTSPAKCANRTITASLDATPQHSIPKARRCC